MSQNCVAKTEARPQLSAAANDRFEPDAEYHTPALSLPLAANHRMVESVSP